jgi:alkaline phosphatase D
VKHTRREIVGAGLGLASLAALRPGAGRAAEPTFSSDPFSLGVASGYPEDAAVVLWTRLAPEPLAPAGGMPDAAFAVQWEVAADELFRDVVRTGQTYATADWAHSVHVEVTGLMPGRDYWYRFTCGNARSPVGRTRTTLARGAALDELKLAVACCQMYEDGHYAAYRAIARDDLDLVVHLGDYIYEQRGASRVRSHDASEAFTLEDYRLRYAIYKSDTHLQAAHAACAWLVTSDDHEVDNDYAADLSEDRDQPGLFLQRRAAAYHAYYEHLPLPRRLIPLGAHQRLQTSRSFGDLVDLFMLDGRQYRSPQACGERYARPCAEMLTEQRQMLGEAQERWLMAGLQASRARWRLLGQQTVFAHFDQSGDGERAYWADGWSGYPAARARLVDFIAERRIANPVVLSGDIHAFLVNDVNLRPQDYESPIVATELVTSSISSGGVAQRTMDGWLAENPNVRLGVAGVRGYLKIAVRPENLHADLIAVDDPAREDSATHVLASFDVADGKPGVVRG